MSDAPEDRRTRGRDLMKQVYGWDIDHVEGPFVEATVAHTSRSAPVLLSSCTVQSPVSRGQ